MPPKIHLVRHAEGVHNLSHEFWYVRDPQITDKGKAQCAKLRDEFLDHANVELIVASPLRRTIYTALEAFAPVFEGRKDLKLILNADLQEASDFPCDIGSDVANLRKEFEEGSQTGRYHPGREAVSARAREARLWLKARPEKEIVVVAHGGLMHFLNGDWEDCCKNEATGWDNAEYRTYEFDTARIDEDLPMLETPESRLRRGKAGPQPSHEEQSSLRESGLRGWAEQGYAVPE
ncbi:histidine phosphatase superfamily [Penicillium brevicompactum]